MGRIIVIILAFLLILGAVVGGLYYWGINPLAKLGLAPTHPAPAGQHVVVATQPAYVDFGLLVVPIIQNHQVKSQAEMILRLQVSPSAKDRVAAMIPLLQASYLEDLMDFLPLSLHESPTLDLDAIRRQLVAVSRRVLGPRAIEDVIIENAAVRQLPGS